MFEKFGEFDSAEELNRAAAGQKAEGDIEALIALAVENGIDKEDAQDYADGCVDELCSQLMAALGKIEVESQELQPYEIMQDWVEYIKMRCAESKEIAVAVRRKGKSLKGCIAELMTWSFENAKPVDKDIISIAKKSVENLPNRILLGIPGIGTAKKLITDYYLR